MKGGLTSQKRSGQLPDNQINPDSMGQKRNQVTRTSLTMEECMWKRRGNHLTFSPKKKHSRLAAGPESAQTCKKGEKPKKHKTAEKGKPEILSTPVKYFDMSARLVKEGKWVFRREKKKKKD